MSEWLCDPQRLLIVKKISAIRVQKVKAVGSTTAFYNN